MEKNGYEVLSRCPLFAGMRGEEITDVLECLSADSRDYSAGEFVLSAGDMTGFLGIVTEGTVSVIREDYWGNRDIMTKLGAGELFAETYACLSDVAMGVSVVADNMAKVIFLDVQKILSAEGSGCGYHDRVTRNLISVMARKNLFMNRKLIHVTQRTTREKLLSYLSQVSEERGSSEFEIPFNRQELADYLSVDRSAMSAELCRMRDEGIIEFRKNRFSLL